MNNLSVIQTENVREYAQQLKLKVVADFLSEDFEFDLPPARAILDRQRLLLPALRLRNFGSVIVKFPEAVIHGPNLGTIHEGALLPSGYCHSFNWAEFGGFSDDGTTASAPSLPCVDIEGELETFILGITTHFGHFFTDCLDRLLAIDAAGKATAGRYAVNGALLPQVREIIDLLGVDIPDSRLFIVNPARDYRIRNLNMVTLGAAKPAITLSSFRILRERVLARVQKQPLLGRAIYVGRRGVSKRLILNQAEIELDLHNLGFTAFYPEEHSFRETVEAFHAANIVVIVIGSSKFNLAFCQPGTLVVCLAPQGYVEQGGAVSTMLRQLCALFRLELCFCSCEVSGPNVGLDSNLIIDNLALHQALKALQA